MAKIYLVQPMTCWQMHHIYIRHLCWQIRHINIIQKTIHYAQYTNHTQKTIHNTQYINHTETLSSYLELIKTTSINFKFNLNKTLCLELDIRFCSSEIQILDYIQIQLFIINLNLPLY